MLIQCVKCSMKSPSARCKLCDQTPVETTHKCPRCPDSALFQVGVWLHCSTKSCRFVSHVDELKTLTESAEMRRDVHQMLREDQHKGSRKSSSSGKSRKEDKLRSVSVAILDKMDRENDMAARLHRTAPKAFLNVRVDALPEDVLEAGIELLNEATSDD